MGSENMAADLQRERDPNALLNDVSIIYATGRGSRSPALEDGGRIPKRMPSSGSPRKPWTRARLTPTVPRSNSGLAGSPWEATFMSIAAAVSVSEPAGWRMAVSALLAHRCRSSLN
jgi:hypothetical protein